MIKVAKTLAFSDYTLFLSVNIMDRYLKYGPKGLKRDQMHIIGVVSLLIASKFQDGNRLSMEFLDNIISYHGFTRKQIKNMERNVIITLQFELKVSLSYDFFLHLIEVLNPIPIIQKIAEILLVLNQFDYNNHYYPFEEAAAAFFIAARSLNQIDLMDNITEIVELADENIEYAVILMQNSMSGYKLTQLKFLSPMKFFNFEFETFETKAFFKFCDRDIQITQERLLY